jgi:NAD+ synthetase
MITLCLVQEDFRWGSIQENLKKIINLSKEAWQQHPEALIVFPELALLGYPPKDDLWLPQRQENIEQALRILQRQSTFYSRGGLLFGAPEFTPKGIYNAAYFLQNGIGQFVYRKQCLPHDDIFDEPRYFLTGHAPYILSWQGVRFGLLICEDIWQDAPIQQLLSLHPDALIVLNASPYELHKSIKRSLRFAQVQAQLPLPLFYVNYSAAQEEWLFDGDSQVIDDKGSIISHAGTFQKQHLIVSWPLSNTLSPSPLPVAPVYFSLLAAVDATADDADILRLRQALVFAIQQYWQQAGFDKAILGLSGGIDSALVLALAVEALGKEAVTAIFLPSPYTSALSKTLAEEQARLLHVDFEIYNISEGFAWLQQTINPQKILTLENAQSRLRGMLLMALAAEKNALLLTTGNKSEYATGYATLYGDMCGAFAPLKDLYKTDVYRLANFLNQERLVIPQAVIDRPPTAELRENQQDQDNLPPYPQLDTFLVHYLEKQHSLAQLQAEFPEAQALLSLVNRNEFKRFQSAPGPRLSPNAFGLGRRYPLQIILG